MIKLKCLRDTVESILEENVAAQNSDWELVRLVYGRLGIGNWTINQLCRNHEDIPSFDSITRARRSITEHRPELRGSKVIEQMRFDTQKDYIEFYGGEQ